MIDVVFDLRKPDATVATVAMNIFRLVLELWIRALDLVYHHVMD